MTNLPVDNTLSDLPLSAPDPKDRTCLRCNATFASGWAGERVCNRCKSSSGWRSGTPPQSFASRSAAK